MMYRSILEASASWMALERCSSILQFVPIKKSVSSPYTALLADKRVAGSANGSVLKRIGDFELLPSGGRHDSTVWNDFFVWKSQPGQSKVDPRGFRFLLL